MYGYQLRAILLIVLVVLLLAAFTALGLWGPTGKCVDVVDYCDTVI